MAPPGEGISAEGARLMSTTSPPQKPLYDGEEWWQARYNWFQERGYQLRRRYSPDWVPSWQGKNVLKDDCEDGQTFRYGNVGDAVRISDSALVSLKVIHKSDHPHEADIAQLFSSNFHVSDPNNRCVPVFDILQDPHNEDELILVMPLLRLFNNPRFDTIGEVIELFTQICEGLRYMHKNHVAHRDVMGQNIMMDATPLYPIPFHPARPEMRRDWKGKVKHFTRTQRPVKYYFIDFGLSRRYSPDDENPLEDPILGGDKTVPEFQNSVEPCNPFPTDVYYLGSTIRRYFLNEACGFEFMAPLVADMVQDDPTRRPNMDQVVTRFEAIRELLSGWKLRSRVVLKSDSSLPGFFRTITHWYRRIGFIIKGVSAIPTPKPITV